MAKSKVIWKKQSPLGLIEVRDGKDIYIYNFYANDDDWFMSTSSDDFDEEEIMDFWRAVQMEYVRRENDAKLYEAYEEYRAKAH